MVSCPEYRRNDKRRKAVSVETFLLCIVALCLHAGAQQKAGSALPSFSLVDRKASTFNSKQAFATGKPLAVIYFSPYCAHCTRLIEEVAENDLIMKKMNLLLVTSFESEDYSTFIITRGLHKKPNINVGTDNAGAFAKTFGFKQVPAVAVFDSKFRLKNAFEQEVSPEKIKRLAGL